MKDKGIRACIPGRKQRKKPVKYDKRRYKRRNRIEIMFGRLKDWRRVAARYDLSRKHGVSSATLYKYKPKYGGLEVSDARRLRALEDENSRLKKIVADLTLDREMLQDVIRRKL